MNISTLVEEFASLGITVTRTPEGKLFATPRRLLTDELREWLRAAKAQMEAQEDPDAPTLRVLEPMGETITSVPTGPAPELTMVDGKELKIDPYGIHGGVWYGPGIEKMQRGTCGACGWAGVPMVSGADSRCTLCWQAEERAVGQTPLCETFCDVGQTLLLQPSRFEPGGSLSCEACAERMLQIKARHHQRDNESTIARQQSM